MRKCLIALLLLVGCDNGKKKEQTYDPHAATATMTRTATPGASILFVNDTPTHIGIGSKFAAIDPNTSEAEQALLMTAPSVVSTEWVDSKGDKVRLSTAVNGEHGVQDHVEAVKSRR